MDEISMRVTALKLCSHAKEFSEMREKPILLPIKWTTYKAVCNETEVGHTKQSLLQALVLSLRGIADAMEETPSRGYGWLNDMFVSINACFQNFPYGREALKQEIQRFFPLLPKTLNGYMEAIRNMGHGVSPTCRNRYYLFIQNILRFHVAVMSEWNTQLLIRDPEAIRQLQIYAYKVARDRDTPWDVRSIAGLTIGHNARFLHEFDIYFKNCCNPLGLNELPVQAAALLVLQAGEYTTLAKNALSILQRILAVATSDENFSSILVFLSKNLLIYSKSLGKVTELHDSALNFFKLIICALQEFSVYHICSNIDSVRHTCSALLRQVLQLALSLNLEKAFKYVYALFERQKMPLSSRCLILEQLVLVLDVKLVISNCPSLFKMVFPKYLGHEDCVDSLFKTMMTNAFSNQSFIDWNNMWCDMLITTAKASDDRLPAVERIIMHSANLSQEFLNLVLHETVPLSTKLAAMLTIRQVPLRREVQILYKQQLNEALVGLDDHTRILAFRFVVEMPCPSKCFGSDELDAIMLYLQHNANNPSAHIRQLSFGLFKKALQRIELNLAQHMKRPIYSGEELLKFFTKFMAKLSYNLFPTANYGRRWISLRLLHLCVEICCRQDIPFIEKLPNVTVPYLKHCLSDSYEHNKKHASHLLCIVSKKSRLQPVKIMEMLLSLRPPDSSTGAYQLQVYCQSVEVEEELPLLIDITVYEPKTYKALMWCYKHLREGTFFAQQDLAEAAKINPLYGLLCASRHLIMQLNMDKLAQEMKWRQYISELLDLCMAIIKVVLPIVSSSSPEGYLPASRYNQIKDMENANVLRRRLKAKTVQQLHTTPQMVLLCGWRSVKEIALILGELVQRAPLEQENPDSFLLEKSQLSAIGDIFLMLLSETKHRGAFEQAYVGFTMLCRRFWLSDEVSLNQQPNLWVQEAMLMIEGSNKNLCLTRRSAGMPFMLQALICTELKLGTHGTLYKTIYLLLNICERRTSSVVSRSHALNTLRALYRCSELSDFVGEFVSRGVICALGCLLADEWSERNSATLTLAAIIVRVFGVERARSYKGDFHIRNRMTGRVFFTLYPELFDFFYIGLKHATVKINDQSSGNRSTEQTIQLEAMLLILCRLYPSSSEGSESSLNLIEFVPFLKSITKSHDLVTRQRASQIIANFVSLHRSVELIRKIIFHLIVLEQQLRRDFLLLKNNYSRLKLDWNYLHGQVLQLHHLYRVIRWTYPSLSCLVVFTLSQLAIQVCHCDIFVFIAIIDVLVTIMEDICDLNQINPKVMDAVFDVYRLNHDWVYKRCEKNATSPRSFAVFALHLNRLIFQNKGIMQYLKDFMEQENLSADCVKEIRPFTGEAAQYPTWIRQAEAIVRDYEVARDKLIYRAVVLHLRSKIEGRADKMLISSDVADDDWPEVRKVLASNYEDKRDIWTLEYQMNMLVRGDGNLEGYYNNINRHLSLIVAKLRNAGHAKGVLEALIGSYRERALRVFIRGLPQEMAGLITDRGPTPIPTGIKWLPKPADYQAGHQNGTGNLKATLNNEQLYEEMPTIAVNERTPTTL
ncbi:uncharacterized protein Dwil_GK25461 [Drosophila willistoni]|uniref:tRNA (32-2'-O)-methyltransferase regulator THADA n=1 Tax=Drosophila willistoni TaxID=7260 RepID=B4NDD4_DROWI|nr:uncharacterized protein Dwil_GK25461 [Drosophila willistoni]